MSLSIIGIDNEPSFIDITPIQQIKNSNELFTQREIQILQLLAKDLTSKEIAEELNISASTVSTHRKNMHFKTGATNALQLIKFGIEKGWVEL